MKSYFERKNKEFQLLNSKYYSNIENSIENIKYLMDLKLKNQANLKTDFIKSTYNYQNTSRDNQKIIYNGLECEYEYQRYDINIKQHDFLNIFYDLKSLEYDYVFTNCGMSALSSTFYALNKLSYYIEYIGNIYVETERLIDDYIQNKNMDDLKKKALLIDTVCFNSLLETIANCDLSKYELFIIDTTLYLYSELKSLIEKLSFYDRPIILIKSHTKLDMLGNEWSKLGSICIINSEKDFIKNLLKEIKIVLSFIGGFAYCEDIPLFLSHPDYKKITYDRNIIIKSNTDYVFNKLKNKISNCDIIKPIHNMFVLVKPKKFIDYKKLENDIHEYTNNSKLKGLICYADSFGLDCFGINGYYENMSAETEVIRISPSDFPLEICDLIVDDIIKWLSDYLIEEDY